MANKKDGKEHIFPDYVNTTIAAKMLSMSKPTLIKEVDAGNINAYIVRGRYKFKEVDIQAYIEAHTTRKRGGLRQEDYKFIRIKDPVSATQ